MDDLLDESAAHGRGGERVLVTTLTKRMAEDLTDYLQAGGIRVAYLHSDIDALERVEILRALRLGEFDVLVGINLLREGLDLPEVSLVAILDADKEGFLRSAHQPHPDGRPRRAPPVGRVILYADVETDSIRRAVEETNRRRAPPGGLQQGARHHADEHPQEPGRDRRATQVADARRHEGARRPPSAWPLRAPGPLQRIAVLEEEMQREAAALNFEAAASLRDLAAELRIALVAGQGRSACERRSLADLAATSCGRRPCRSWSWRSPRTWRRRATSRRATSTRAATARAARLVAREAGVLAGLPLFLFVFRAAAARLALARAPAGGRRRRRWPADALELLETAPEGLHFGAGETLARWPRPRPSCTPASARR